ncbi:MAG: phage tail sheath subtilisin-like domain-containing protein [Candidatus Marinimicrobia bacterium]|nr:phage tail sheath subtilisin-like domain-containing protein [Candidatus Neomarinimicrobiota bacterium]
MATLISPGFATRERDLSLYAPALATSIAGIQGVTTKGPINERKLLTNEAQFTQEFGRPRVADYAVHAAIQYLKAGRQLIFVRVAGTDQAKGSVGLSDAGGPVATPGFIVGTEVAPFDFLTTLAITADVETRDLIGAVDGNPNDTAAFSGTRARRAGSGLSITDLTALTLILKIDGGANQTITFTGAESVVGDVINTINATLVGAAAVLVTTEVDIISDTFGTGSSVEVVGGTALAQIGHSTGTSSGAGDVVSLAAVTVAEVKTVVEAAWISGSGVTVTDVASAVKITSDTTGASSSIQVDATSDVESVLGFDVILHSGAAAGAILQTTTLTALTDGTWSDDLKVRVRDVATSDFKDNIGTGDGTTSQVIASTLTEKPVEASSVTVSFTRGGTPITATDDGAGAITGTGVTGTIDYTTGAISLTFGTAIDNDTNVFTDYQVQTWVFEFLDRDIIVETFSGLTKGNYVARLNTGVVTATQTIPASQNVTAVDDIASDQPPAEGTFSFSGGDNGDNVTDAERIGVLVPNRTGLQLFGDPEEVDINIVTLPGVFSSAVIVAVFELVEARQDAIAVIDSPNDLSAEDVRAWHNGDTSIATSQGTNSVQFNTSFAALYWPWVEVFDKFTNQKIEVPPSGHVLRTMAHTDTVAEAWFAPAGPNRSQTIDILSLQVQDNPGQDKRDILQEPGQNVNPIARFRGFGFLIFGQKTLQRSPTALDRINVRRLLLVLRKVVATVGFTLTFEPADETLFRRFVNLVSPILEDVAAKRGLSDFGVIMDKSTNPPEQLAQNSLNGQIFIKPTPTAEKITADFNITPQSVSFGEFTQS